MLPSREWVFLKDKKDNAARAKGAEAFSCVCGSAAFNLVSIKWPQTDIDHKKCHLYAQFQENAVLG